MNATKRPSGDIDKNHRLLSSPSVPAELTLTRSIIWAGAGTAAAARTIDASAGRAERRGGMEGLLRRARAREAATIGTAPRTVNPSSCGSPRGATTIPPPRGRGREEERRDGRARRGPAEADLDLDPRGPHPSLLRAAVAAAHGALRRRRDLRLSRREQDQPARQRLHELGRRGLERAGHGAAAPEHRGGHRPRAGLPRLSEPPVDRAAEGLPHRRREAAR